MSTTTRPDLITQRTFSLFRDRGDIVQRVACNRDDIGIKARRYGAETLLHSKHGSRFGRSGLQRLRGCHPHLHEPVELAHVQTPAVVNRIRADDHARAGLKRFLRSFKIALNVIEQALFGSRREMMDTVRVLDVVLVVIDRRNVVNFPLDHLRNGLIVHVRRMFERIGARPNGIACARRPVRMNRDFLSERMSGVHRSLHLLECERLKLSHIVETTGRSEDLHPIGPGRDDLPHRVNDRIHSIGHDADGRRWRGAASDPDPEARDEHARTDHPAHVYQLAHRQVRPVRSVEISNRRHARLERLLRILLCEKYRDGRMPRRLVARRGNCRPSST